MPTIASVSDDVSKNKASIVKAALLSAVLAVTGVKFIKWAKNEIEGEN